MRIGCAILAADGPALRPGLGSNREGGGEPPGWEIDFIFVASTCPERLDEARSRSHTPRGVQPSLARLPGWTRRLSALRALGLPEGPGVRGLRRLPPPCVLGAALAPEGPPAEFSRTR